MHLQTTEKNNLDDHKITLIDSTANFLRLNFNAIPSCDHHHVVCCLESLQFSPLVNGNKWTVLYMILTVFVYIETGFSKKYEFTCMQRIPTPFHGIYVHICLYIRPRRIPLLLLLLLVSKKYTCALLVLHSVAHAAYLLWSSYCRYCAESRSFDWSGWQWKVMQD